MRKRWDGMKRIFALILSMLLLCGCSGTAEQMDRAMALRGKIQQKEVAFAVALTADYGDKIHTFSMECRGDIQGNMKFTVLQPQSIAGITGVIAKDSGKLTFDDQVLAFDVLADGLISPVSGPWVLLETLRSGYLTSCAMEGEQLRLAIDDSYQEKALHLDVWLDSADLPKRCEIYWQGRRLLSMDVSNFTFL